MKSLLLLTTLLNLALSLPTEPAAALAPAPAPPQQVYLVFHAAPVQYELTIPADGKFHPTRPTSTSTGASSIKTSGPAAYVWQAAPNVYDWRMSRYLLRERHVSWWLL
ncbi:hypothetical protein B0T25DRAFT_572583 [Lasiosphaeria hispida]|uniref:Uncharacterized protein n=1 Tax=Lasiosphaeria hispida TaxID=260671 RepID=A0AAJ0H8P9_9PEZI|nr:hypothetical protein B0T25DRAFT_572583 [Lasiosphaeria hispida]